ncbi:MAG: hypothetical protein IT292_06295 [Deltaproteobacteria bacterium]|nr:hypothetical protein [Deltaproteobacteria bacterium]
MRYYVRTGNKQHRFDLADVVDLSKQLSFELGKYLIRLVVKNISPQGEIKSVYVNNKYYTVNIRCRSDGVPYKVILNGHAYPVQIERVESTRYKPPVISQQPLTEVRSPLPGTIAKILIVRGEKIAKSQAMFLLETMEMDQEILAPRDAIVENILVKEGDLVHKSKALVKFQS